MQFFSKLVAYVTFFRKKMQKMTLEDMHKEDIKAAIRKKGLTLSDLSLRAGLSKSTVRTALLKCIPSAWQTHYISVNRLARYW
jgi:hypothetical protein